jgi:hypothetical protein
MKTGEETALFLLGLIDASYKRPLMYAGTGDAFETLMHYWHTILGFILDRKLDFDAAGQKVRKAARCPAAQSFSTYYRNRYPNASESKVANYVVSKWRSIDRLIGLEFPRVQIDEMWDRYNKGAG